METLYQIMGFAGAGLIVWLMYRTIKNRPEMFSRDSLNKSFASMGILALILMAFVAFLIFLVRST